MRLSRGGAIQWWSVEYCGAYPTTAEDKRFFLRRVPWLGESVSVTAVFSPRLDCASYIGMLFLLSLAACVIMSLCSELIGYVLYLACGELDFGCCPTTPYSVDMRTSSHAFFVCRN